MIVDVTSSAARSLLDAAIDRFRGGGDPQGYLAGGTALAYVATDGSRLDAGHALGWCWGYLLRRPDGATMAYLHELEVAEDARRVGHGAALLRSFLDGAAAGGATKAFLLTELDNMPAQALYRSAGGRPPEHGPVTSYWFALP